MTIFCNKMMDKKPAAISTFADVNLMRQAIESLTRLSRE